MPTSLPVSAWKFPINFIKYFYSFCMHFLILIRLQFSDAIWQKERVDDNVQDIQSIGNPSNKTQILYVHVCISIIKFNDEKQIHTIMDSKVYLHSIYSMGFYLNNKSQLARQVEVTLIQHHINHFNLESTLNQHHVPAGNTQHLINLFPMLPNQT